MSDRTRIAWTNATWNPVTGCTKVSPGCDHCYAERLIKHRGGDFATVALHPERMGVPFHWRKPKMIFTCSMGDLFHPRISWEFIAHVFAMMERCPKHTFQVLTKRPGRMAHFSNVFWPNQGHGLGLDSMHECGWPFNVWSGTSLESDKYLPRLDVLARVPAKVRFVSCEPLLEALDLRRWLSNDSSWADSLSAEKILDWVIVGGESGPGARPMEIAWVADIVAQCKEAGVPCFVKQDSGPLPGMQGRIPDDLWAIKEYPSGETRQ